MSLSQGPLSMNSNPLGLYHFFSRLLPGLAFLVGLGVFLSPRDLLALSTSPFVILVLVLGFAAGQLVHSVAVLVEKSLRPFTKTHRDYFSAIVGREVRGESVDRSTPTGRTFADAFERVYGFDASRVGTGRLYSIIRSRIEIDGRGRVAQYQALRSFSRSMAVSLGLVLICAVVGRGVLAVTAASYRPVLVRLSTIHLAATALPVLVAMGSFVYGNTFYKRRYAEYLVVDFVNIVSVTGTGVDFDPIQPEREETGSESGAVAEEASPESRTVDTASAESRQP